MEEEERSRDRSVRWKPQSRRERRVVSPKQAFTRWKYLQTTCRRPRSSPPDALSSTSRCQTLNTVRAADSWISCSVTSIWTLTVHYLPAPLCWFCICVYSVVKWCKENKGYNRDFRIISVCSLKPDPRPPFHSVFIFYPVCTPDKPAAGVAPLHMKTLKLKHSVSSEWTMQR